MAAGGGDIDRPMAGAADVGFAALGDRLEGADLAGHGVMGAAARPNELAEFVVEAFAGEVALLLGHPFLQAEVRFDDELGHGPSSSKRRQRAPAKRVAPSLRRQQRRPAPVRAIAYRKHPSYSPVDRTAISGASRQQRSSEGNVAREESAMSRVHSLVTS